MLSPARPTRPGTGHEADDGDRPLHAVLLSGVADAGRLVEPLARALDGTGPAILPLDADLPGRDDQAAHRRLPAQRGH